MNELAAIMFYIVRSDEYTGEESSIEADLCGPKHSEADAFTLFSHLMDSGVREMFAVEKGAAIKRSDLKASPIGELPGAMRRAPVNDNPQSALLARCKHIIDDVLKTVDSQLHRCLEQ